MAATDKFDFVSGYNEGYLTIVKPTIMKNMYNAPIITSPFCSLLDNSFTDDYQGYLHISRTSRIAIDGQSIPVQVGPFPRLLLIGGADTVTPEFPHGINQGYPCVYSKINIVRGVQDYPFPKLMLIAGEKTDGINQGYPCCFSKINVIRGVQTTPFPKLMPSLEEESDWYPCFRHNVHGFGAGSNTKELEEVEFPKSIKWIADYAFYNSKIKKVKIPAKCIYFRHSFPRGTKIAFYPEETEEDNQ